MLSRRSLFRRLGAFVAVIALAPEIAFSCKLDVQPKLNLQELFDTVYDLMRARREIVGVGEIDIFTDTMGMELLKRDWPEAFKHYQPDRKVGGTWVEPVGIYEQLRSAS